ncbi:MAG: (Fe-S)-binding protein [Verrucomicrobiota bacterium]
MQHSSDSSLSALDDCNQCGFCLPACPTYQRSGLESESPRGRLHLMNQVHRGETSAKTIVPHLDTCLRCRACEPACPPGVPYHDILKTFEEKLDSRDTAKTNALDLLSASLLRFFLPRQRWLHPTLRAVRRFPVFGKLLPPAFRRWMMATPASLPPLREVPAAYAGRGIKRGTIALITGCHQSTLLPDIREAAIEVLIRNGFDVVLPDLQRCCGAASSALDDPEEARKFATTFLTNLPDDLEAIITTNQLCHQGLQSLPSLLEQQPDAPSLGSLALLSDFSQFLQTIELAPLPRLSDPAKAVYVDPCSHRFTQQIAIAPRALLQRIEGLEIQDVEEKDACCGAPDFYAIKQPMMAKELGEHRLQNILNTGRDVVISGDPGCLIHLQHHAKALGKSLTFFHTAEVLALAYKGLPLRPR